MDESSVRSPRPWSWRPHRDWHWLALLLALVLPLRIWLLLNTEVTARDSVGFIRIALRLEEKPWSEVVRSFDQHPGYSMAIQMMSALLRAFNDQLTPEIMQRSAQLVSMFAALLLIVPMYYLGKEIWGAPVAFGGALLFQYLPMSGHHLSDGISESLYLLFIAAALLAALWGTARGRLGWFAASGLATGLAYLVRPEGALVLGGVGLALIGFQMSRTWRQRWAVLVRQLACLAAPALLVAAPYVAATGHLTNKPSINQVLHGGALVSEAEPTHRAAGLTAQLFGHSFTTVESLGERLLRGLWAICSEAGYGLHYLGIAPVAFAVWRRGRSLLADRGSWILLAYGLLDVAALLLLAQSAGYVSDRHLMPLLMIFSYLAVLGFLEFAGWLAALPWLQQVVSASAVSGLAFSLLGAFLLFCVPQTLKPLHGNRAGNHEAGRWLAERLQPGDIVLDDHAWSHFYAGQLFLEGKEPPVPAEYRPLCYVVMTRSTDPKVAAKRERWERSLKVSQGRLVYHWPPQRPSDEARVVIFAVPRNPRTHPWVSSDKKMSPVF